MRSFDKCLFYHFAFSTKIEYFRQITNISTRNKHPTCHAKRASCGCAWQLHPHIILFVCYVETTARGTLLFFFVFASWREIYSRSERIIPVKPASFVQPTSPTSLCNTQRGIRNYARCAPYRAHRFSAFLLNPKNKETQITKFESDMSSRVRHVQ